MNCQDVRKVLHGYVDGELDLTTCLALEGHLGECPACARDCVSQRRLGAAIKAEAPYFRATPDLRRRIQTSLPAKKAPQPFARGFPWRMLGMAAAFALVALGGWSLGRFPLHSAPNESLVQELVASHVRSQMVENHRVDVASSDRHTVKPWFEGKVDFAPPVKDLSKQGFVLVGGRLDYLDNRPVAVLVYQRRSHLINLFIWSADHSPTAPNLVDRHGYGLIHWTQDGMTFWAVSNLNEAELRDFTNLIRN